ncbi:sulfatase-like hydrolase/transferase [Haladaptatus caseinilyticus]|uniref:sulfatase-like hydrolase/transferase n=1 Tax=Haladaptatus caseinilyticus TaxID=2993314 RepID=UPI00224B6796|nr:sulfatase-like hydrolase/transferase [Haladaptatus caseinilyticus]
MTNIALVVLDTLRKDSFDKHFNWLPGRRFERAYTTANWTVPAHASLFTGLYPSEVGVHAKNIYCNCEELTLAEQLEAEGYTTRAFSANTNITSHFNFDRGYKDFRTPEKFEKFNQEGIFNFPKFSRETDKHGFRKYIEAVLECVRSESDILPSLLLGAKYAIGDNEMVKYGGALEALSEINDINFGEQEFLFLNLMEAHEPYQAPEEYMSTEDPGLTEAIGDLSIGNENNRELIQQAYDDCAAYLSDIYRKIFGELQEEFDYIITLSDHGEMLGEYDAWGHEHGVYPQLTHVPLCLSGDGLTGNVKKPVNILDVHKTVLDAAGISESQRGQTLLSPVTERDRLTEYIGLTSWSERKLEKNGLGDKIKEYDEPLRGVAGPVDYYGFETTSDFVETGSNQQQSGKERLDTLIDDLKTKHVEQDNAVPEEVEDRLKDLGYA